MAEAEAGIKAATEEVQRLKQAGPYAAYFSRLNLSRYGRDFAKKPPKLSPFGTTCSSPLSMSRHSCGLSRKPLNLSPRSP